MDDLSPHIYNIICNFILPWALRRFIFFMALSTSSSVKSGISSVYGLDFIAPSDVGTILGIE